VNGAGAVGGCVPVIIRRDAIRTLAPAIGDLIQAAAEVVQIVGQAGTSSRLFFQIISCGIALRKYCFWAVLCSGRSSWVWPYPDTPAASTIPSR